jgi:hypothetical protein
MSYQSNFFSDHWGGPPATDIVRSGIVTARNWLYFYPARVLTGSYTFNDGIITVTVPELGSSKSVLLPDYWLPVAGRYPPKINEAIRGNAEGLLANFEWLPRTREHIG